MCARKRNMQPCARANEQLEALAKQRGPTISRQAQGGGEGGVRLAETRSWCGQDTGPTSCEETDQCVATGTTEAEMPSHVSATPRHFIAWTTETALLRSCCCEAMFVGAQHDLDCGAALGLQHAFDLRDAVRTNAGGSTSLASAHASRCARLWQQQLRQHCSAVLQPHWRSMQGKGVLRSLPPAAGTAMPVLTSKYSSTASQPHARNKSPRLVSRGNIQANRQPQSRPNPQVYWPAQRGESSPHSPQDPTGFRRAKLLAKESRCVELRRS